MNSTERARLKYTGIALPTGATTVNMFDTTLTGVRDFLNNARGNRFECSIQNDQAGSLLAYWSDDFGVTWNKYDTQAVAIPAAGASSGPFDYLIDSYKDWKLDWLNGGVTQTTFIVNMALVSGDRDAG
jgi:hypothetical protein